MHVDAAGSSMVLVVPINITFQSLRDRIDAKLQRSSNISLAAHKLKYKDDDDFVSMLSDEDVQVAFDTWRETRAAGGTSMGEVELWVQ